METKANYVLIGAFVLFAAGALALFTLWIAGNPFSRSYKDYDVVFNGPVNGLSEGGEVRFNGIKVGEVTSLGLDPNNPNRVFVHIRVEAKTPVRTDSIAQLNFQGITGVTFIQIFAGKPESPLLTATDGKYPQIPTSRTLVDELFSGGQDLLSVSGDTLHKLNETMSADNIRHLSSTLDNLDRAIAKIAAEDGVVDEASKALVSVAAAAVALESAAKSVDTAASSLGSDFSELQADASRALNKLDPVLDEAHTAMQSVNTAVDQINTTLAPTATRALGQVGNTAADLRAMMSRLQSLLSEVEQDPSRFIYQQPTPVER